MVLLIILGLSGFSLFSDYFYHQQPPAIEPDLSDQDDQTLTQQPVSQLADYQQMNPDTIGYIEIADTDIAFPIVQRDNNEYYLNHSFDGEKNKYGSIFVDYLNKPDFTDQNTVIYGHNLNKPGMFYSLNQFRDQQYIDEHQFITVKLPFETLTYQIFSVYVTEPDYPYRVVNYPNETDFGDFLTQCQQRSLIAAEETITELDSILTLSTCVYDFKDARLAIHAVLTSRVPATTSIASP